jgi:hypothetical protein
MAPRKTKESSNFPSGKRTIVLRDVDEDTWFHLLGTFDARILHFQNRLAEARRFNEPSTIAEHYEWIIDTHKGIKEPMRQQIFNPAPAPAGE